MDELIAQLRQDALIGGGYADVSGENLERLFAEIERLLAENTNMRGALDSIRSIVNASRDLEQTASTE